MQGHANPTSQRCAYLIENRHFAGARWARAIKRRAVIAVPRGVGYDLRPSFEDEECACRDQREPDRVVPAKWLFQIEH